MNWLEIHIVFDQWFTHKICFRYFTDFIPSLFSNGPVNKIRHYVLSYLTGLFRDNYVTNQWNKVETKC